MLYAWQEDDYAAMCRLFTQRQPQALLVVGGNNSGRDQLIQELIRWRLCLTPQTNHACGSCSSCCLYAVGNHPDYYSLVASDESKQATIKIEQIRALLELTARSLHVASVRVIHLPQLNQLNLNSANALLKVLEEPSPATVFILESDNIKRVIPTLRSRCLSYQLKLPQFEQIQSLAAPTPDAQFWLRYFGGEPLFSAPLTAAELQLLIQTLVKPSLYHIFKLSQELDPKKIGLAHLTKLLLSWLADVVLVKQQQAPHYFNTLAPSLPQLAPRANLDKLFALVEATTFVHEWSEHSLNQKLQWENLLLRYQQIYV